MLIKLKHVQECRSRLSVVAICADKWGAFRARPEAFPPPTRFPINHFTHFDCTDNVGGEVKFIRDTYRGRDTCAFQGVVSIVRGVMQRRPSE